MNQQIVSMTVSELSDRLTQKELSAAEATSAYLDRIEAENEKIGAYIHVTAEQALKQASEADKRRAAGEKLSPLAGIPAGIKDNVCTKGVPTTCASRMLENFVPPYNAAVMENFENQHIVMLGKLNMDEFAMGSTNQTSFFGPVRNPRNLSRVPGGSSGGSAAAVAAGHAAFALGSDTGGSIRQPAAFCGVVGMRPTYGAVSRRGVVAFASSLDQVGPVTKNVRDSALVMQMLAGYDAGDATSLPYDWPSFTDGLEQGVKGLRIALPREYFEEGIDEEVAAAVRAAAAQYERLGAVVEEVSMPNMRYALPAYYVISCAEGSSNMARFDGVKYGYCTSEYEDLEEMYHKTRSEGFGQEVKRRIMTGNFVLSAGYYDAYYKKALQVRTLVRQEFEKVLSGYDGVLSPVTPTTAYRQDEKSEDPLRLYRGDMYTVPVSMAGMPALSLPCGTDSEGMPIGMQLAGKPFSEPLLYRIAYAFEQNRGEGCL